jgi:hypothetical protein
MAFASFHISVQRLCCPASRPIAKNTHRTFSIRAVLLGLRFYTECYSIESARLPQPSACRSGFRSIDKYVGLGSSCPPHGFLPDYKDSRSKSLVQCPESFNQLWFLLCSVNRKEKLHHTSVVPVGYCWESNSFYLRPYVSVKQSIL